LTNKLKWFSYPALVTPCLSVGLTIWLSLLKFWKPSISSRWPSVLLTQFIVITQLWR